MFEVIIADPKPFNDLRNGASVKTSVTVANDEQEQLQKGKIVNVSLTHTGSQRTEATITRSEKTKIDSQKDGHSIFNLTLIHGISKQIS